MGEDLGGGKEKGEEDGGGEREFGKGESWNGGLFEND